MIKKHILRLLMVFLVAIIVAGCGAGGDGGGGDGGLGDGGGSGGASTGKVTGTIYDLNGVDPVVNAVVYVSQGTQTPRRLYLQGASTCDNPGIQVVTKTCTASDGKFDLSNVPSGEITLGIAKGLFKKEIKTKVQGGGTLTLTKEQGTLPNQSGDGAQIPRIAVVTGDFDRMEDMIAKMGLGTVDSSGAIVNGTERFTLIDGNNSLDDAAYQNFDITIGDINELKKYDIIVINCGNIYEEMLGEQAVRGRLAQYVSDGGRIFATDWSYDFVEQVFPDSLDFLGDDTTPATSPEVMDTAQEGDDGITTNAEVLVPTLKSWLGNVKCGSETNPSNTLSCLNTDGTIHIGDFLSGWAVINGPHQGKEAIVTEWIRGEVSWSGGNGVNPLTMTFPSGSGKILYSSYHTSGEPHPYFLPQERILQYLLFEIQE